MSFLIFVRSKKVLPLTLLPYLNGFFMACILPYPYSKVNSVTLNRFCHPKKNGISLSNFQGYPKNQTISRRFTTFAGFPATTVHGGTSFVTTAPAATTAPSLTVTPGKTVAPVAIQTLSMILIGLVTRSKCGECTSCEPVNNRTSSPTQHLFPILILSRQYTHVCNPTDD